MCSIAGCFKAGYACQAGAIIAQPVIGLHTGHSRWGQMREHINQVATEMAIRKTLTYVEKSGVNLPEPVRVAMAGAMGQFSHFGNTLLPIKAGVTFYDIIPLDDNVKKFFLTREVAALKTNRTLFTGLISLICSIAATILLLPKFPTGGWFLGALVGGVAAQAFQAINDRRIDQLAMKYSTPEVQNATIAHLLELARDPLLSPIQTMKLTARVEQLRSYIV